jgi:zinc finger protein
MPVGRKKPGAEGSAKKVETLEGETCPVCMKKTLTLTQAEDDIPYFGKVFIFGMRCSACGYNKADIEAAEKRKPVKQTIDIKSGKDLQIKVVRSSEGTIRVQNIGTMEPGEGAEGFVSNVESVLQRFVRMTEQLRDSAEDEEDKEKARKVIKKLHRVIAGMDPIKISIEDPSGNSGFVVEK